MKKNRVIIIHGTECTPNSHWFPWLKSELDGLGLKWICPQFPTPEEQNLSNWESVFHKYVGDVEDNDVLIGFSTGVALALNILNKSNVSIRATFLVSGFVGDNGVFEKYDKLNETFFAEEFNWLKIQRNGGQIFAYNGDDDPYVPIEKGRELAKLLNVTLSVVKNGGHINTETGYTHFHELLNDFKEI